MKILTLLLVVAEIYAKHEIYAGWKSYYVKPMNYKQLEKLGSKIIEFELDFISDAALNQEGIVLVNLEHQAEFLRFLEDENIVYWIHVEDIKTQLDIEDQKIEIRRIESRSENRGSLPYDNYQPLEVIYEYIDKIAEQYPETVTLVQNSRSFEGRPLKYLKISNDSFKSNKPVIYIDGGIHAREWISPPTVTYAIHKLVENLTEPDLLDKFDWILFPIVNPDGYFFSYNIDRFWRKTRSTDQNIFSFVCRGVDGNRNYDFEWNKVGTSNSPCSSIYAGRKPFSETETRTVSDIIDENLDRLVLFITMHSYGSMILYPWGHDGSLSENAMALENVGVKIAHAIDELSLPYFRNYTVGNSAKVIRYNASGAAEDYAHFKGVPLAYTIELPSLGFQGFHLDPTYIHQVCVETWVGISVGARMAGEMYGNKI